MGVSHLAWLGIMSFRAVYSQMSSMSSVGSSYRVNNIHCFLFSSQAVGMARRLQ